MVCVGAKHAIAWRERPLAETIIILTRAAAYVSDAEVAASTSSVICILILTRAHRTIGKKLTPPRASLNGVINMHIIIHATRDLIGERMFGVTMIIFMTLAI
jgi:hypothetical protein